MLAQFFKPAVFLHHMFTPAIPKGSEKGTGIRFEVPKCPQQSQGLLLKSAAVSPGLWEISQGKKITRCERFWDSTLKKKKKL